MADENKGDLARERTDFAEDRTVLANERTFAGWLRTGYAGIGIGLAFNALFGRVEPGWMAKLIATVFLIIAIMIFLGAEQRACAVLSRLETHKVQSAKMTNVRLVAYLSIAATAALIAAIWLLTFEPPAAV
jgi:putative membrane protein